MSQIKLLNNTAIEIYNHIKSLPIIDYHNHLSPKELYENKPFETISELWLKGDHYKWRMMRFSGYDDRNEYQRQQFMDYISSIDGAHRNPLYVWSKMELETYFDIHTPLTKENAGDIYEMCNQNLKNNEVIPRNLLERLKVEAICTTDDIADSLIYHEYLKEDESFGINVYPTFRPDRIFNLNNDVFKQVCQDLGSPSILSEMIDAIRDRVEYFLERGCRIADHGLQTFKIF